MNVSKILIAAVLLALSSQVSATWTVGANAGVMSVSFDENSVDSDPINVGVVLGYHFNPSLQGLGGELEITRSISSGEIAELPANNNELEVESQGLYLTYRLGSTYYVKGRIGYMRADLTGQLGEDESGETYGLTGGYSVGNIAVELSATSIDDDVFYGAIGIVYTLP